MATGNYAAALKLVLKSEGGWSDDNRDPGGATMQGVTQKTYDVWRRSHGLKLQSVRHISQAELAQLYAATFWNVIQGDQLPAGLDYAVFDAAVNSGTGRAPKWLQQIVGVDADGYIGPRTIAAVMQHDIRDLIERYCDARLAYLQHLPTWPTFGRGWSRRVADVRVHALGMLGKRRAVA